MRILFVSRAWPPEAGGIERQNFELARALERRANLQVVLNRRGKSFLPAFVLIALYRMFKLRREYDVVLLGDGVLTVLAWLMRAFSAAPVVCIVHGLDITYPHALYRKFWLGLFFHSVDRFIAVGRETIVQANHRHLDARRFVFIPNGVDVHQQVGEPGGREKLRELLGYEPRGPVLLTLGRLVRRKGVAWFLREVFPSLGPEYSYIIAGRGSEEATIRKLLSRQEVQARAVFLGAVSEEEKHLLLNAASLFLQPNVPVEHDMEGFGLVVLEAGLHGKWVLASALEGLKDAVTPGENGQLLPTCDARAYLEAINQLCAYPEELKRKGEHARRFITNRYSWDSIAEQYLETLQESLAPPNERSQGSRSSV